MIDAAIWLLRWTLAGAALSAIVVATAYVLERKGRAVGLALFRTALITALAAPMVALLPPVFTFSAPGTALTEPDRLVPRFIEARDAEAADATADAQTREHPALRPAVSAGALAGALLALWIAGAATAAISRQRSFSRLSHAFRRGAPFSTSLVECRLSADAPTPLLFGVFRPCMLAPADFSDWPDAEREAVLRHEAAHARRGDLLWAFVGDVVRIVYWSAPPVRLLVWRHLLATEEACDSDSFAPNEDRHEYARTLLAVARRVGGHTSPGLAMTASSLRRRIERLISPATNGGATSGWPVLAAAAPAAFMLALSAPAAAGMNPFRLYIYAAAGQATSIYAVSDGERATAASVEDCDGRLVSNAAAIVDELEVRIHNEGEDELNVVWIPGPGSKTELGSCKTKEPRDEDSRDNEDSLVLITDASEKQARRFIRQIDALSRSERQEMAAALGLN